MKCIRNTEEITTHDPPLAVILGPVPIWVALRPTSPEGHAYTELVCVLSGIPHVLVGKEMDSVPAQKPGNLGMFIYRIKYFQGSKGKTYDFPPADISGKVQNRVALRPDLPPGIKSQSKDNHSSSSLD